MESRFLVSKNGDCDDGYYKLSLHVPKGMRDKAMRKDKASKSEGDKVKWEIQGDLLAI